MAARQLGMTFLQQQCRLAMMYSRLQCEVLGMDIAHLPVLTDLPELRLSLLSERPTFLQGRGDSEDEDSCDDDESAEPTGEDKEKHEDREMIKEDDDERNKQHQPTGQDNEQANPELTRKGDDEHNEQRQPTRQGNKQ